MAENLLQTGVQRDVGRYLDLLARRGAVVAGNIANVDTPGYRTRDIDFSREWQRMIADPEHEPVVRDVPSLTERPDGNNVSVDREGLQLAQTQLQFQTGVQLLRSEFRRLSIAINEGR